MRATNEVIMPALGMVQETGKIVQWLVKEGQPVKQGDPLLEVETDKAVAEIESPASGVLSQVSAQDGDTVPVGTVIATILPAGQPTGQPTSRLEARKSGVFASPVAARMAVEHGLDLQAILPQGGRVEKADVLAYLQAQENRSPVASTVPARPPRPLASPKARRLAAERSLDLSIIHGSGIEGAVLAEDIAAYLSASAQPAAAPVPAAMPSGAQATEITPSSIWRIMSERTIAAWTQAPHFYLLREVNASRLISWREAAQKDQEIKITYTDLLVRLVAAALEKHPRVNAMVQAGKVQLFPDIHIGLAVAVEDGLVVPVIHKANEKSLVEIASTRASLVEKARLGRLRPEDISGGTFTISNLGMYGVDAFLAVLNPPQAAILAVGRIAERVVPVKGQIAIQPMLDLSLSFDHRALDGARGAQFLDTLAGLIEEPMGLVK